MVKRPQQRYDALFRELRMRNEVSSAAQISTAQISTAQISAAQISAAATSEANDDMKNELKRYLMELNGSTAYLDSQPQPQSLSNSNFIELGSMYQ